MSNAWNGAKTALREFIAHLKRGKSLKSITKATTSRAKKKMKSI